MPLNYRKNSITCSTQYYPNTSDLNGPNVCQNVRVNLQFGGQTQYIGLVSPTHEQASDLSVNICGQSLRLAKISKYQTKIFGWGFNSFGQFGNNTTTGSCIPIETTTTSCFRLVSAGGCHSLGIDTNNKLWTWGLNSSGQLGNNCTTTSCVPINISPTCSFLYASAGTSHSLAIDTNGKLWSWGNNTYGQLGDNTVTNRCIPVAVCSTCSFCAIRGGLFSSLAIDTTGKLWSWGENGWGTLGNNSTVNRCIPVAVCSTCSFRNISLVVYHSIAIDINNKIWTWGNNTYGQLGNNTTTGSCIPINISPTCSFCYAETGNYHTLAIDTTGKLWSWGYNDQGQLGNNTYSLGTCRCIPVAVCSLCSFCNISAKSHSMAVDTTGKAWTWGCNCIGQLGNNSTSLACSPVAVCSTCYFCNISAGDFYSLGITRDWVITGSPQGLAYPSSYVLPLISATVSYTPTLSNSGSGTLTYSISPSLPSGLSINTSTGVISGTTPSTSNDTTYTITVSNSLGSTSTNIRIRIVYLNTTMTVGIYNDGESDVAWGYQLSNYGSLVSSTFRGVAINTLNIDTSDALYFEVAGTFSNTDSSAFKQIVWNNVTYSRSGLFTTYFSSGGITQWNTANTMVKPFDRVNPPNPSTVSLIIE